MPLIVIHKRNDYDLYCSIAGVSVLSVKAMVY